MGALRQRADSRWFPRHHLVSSKYTERLAFAADDASLGIQARVNDVSQNGLGVTVGTMVRPGQVFQLIFAGREIPMVVIYCIPDLVRQGFYRCGLQRRSSSSENLVVLFAERGLIDIQETSR